MIMSRPQISFEFFPPQNFEGAYRLWDTVNTLAPLNPRFMSVTYGAGGTTRTLTQEATRVLHKHTGCDVAAHLTCVDATRDETLNIAHSYTDTGVTGLVALRGDPPAESGTFRAHEDGFENTVELVGALADLDAFRLFVGAYPQTHPEAADAAQNIDWLKQKLDAGADEALTQFFFEAEDFLRFRDACAKAGITKPITPGILPIENWQGVKRFAKRCGATLPVWLEDAYAKAERDQRTDLLSIALCTELCSELVDEGVEALHFYTLNRPELTRDVCAALGIHPKVTLQHVA
jgi:methylenetetrahydrofolate reductase (NADPH)